MESAHVRSITDGEAEVVAQPKGRTSCWDPFLGHIEGFQTEQETQILSHEHAKMEWDPAFSESTAGWLHSLLSEMMISEGETRILSDL